MADNLPAHKVKGISEAIVLTTFASFSIMLELCDGHKEDIS
ncbi:hypothetical protein ACP6PM_17335 [Dapis sp. BLCC M229]